MSEEMLMNYALFSDSVIIIDTTFNQSRYKWYLMTLVGITSTLESVLMGVALISRQTEQDFAWVFQQMEEADDKLESLDTDERVLVTDQDLALCAAIDNNFKPRS